MEWIGSGTRVFLTTVNTVLKSHLYIAGTKYDDLLTEYVKYASDIIEKYVGYPLTYPVAVFWTNSDGQKITLPPNVATVTKVEIWESAAWVEVTDYTVTVENKSRTTEIYHTSMVPGEYKITTTMTIAPSANIQQCCRLLVAESFENRENKEYKGGYDLMDRKLHMEEIFI